MDSSITTTTVSADANHGELATRKKRQRKSISLAVKLDILRKHERGERISNICKTMGLSESTCRTIIANAPRIMQMAYHSTNVNATRITVSKPEGLIKMENLLMIWLDHQKSQPIKITNTMVQEKARYLYGVVTKNMPNAPPFAASNGWLSKFQKRSAADVQPLKLERVGNNGDINDSSEMQDQDEHNLNTHLELEDEEGTGNFTHSSGLKLECYATDPNTEQHHDHDLQNEDLFEEDLLPLVESPSQIEMEHHEFTAPVSKEEIERAKKLTPTDVALILRHVDAIQKVLNRT